MAVNTHGIKMIGLKKASGETQNYGSFDSRYDEIFFDKTTGEVWTRFHCDLGHNEYTVYHDSNVIKVCTTSNHMTMQQIADAIANAIKEA